MATQTQFITSVKENPIYVGFFHGEFDVCPTETVSTYRPPTLTTIPNNVALLHMTKPGEYLTLSSPILYYLLHKKDFYTNTLMPLFLLESPQDLQYHTGAEYVYWDMEQRKNHTFEDVLESTKKLTTAEAAGALRLMKDITLRKPYDPTTDLTVFSEVLRYDGGDEVPNLKLSVFEDTLLGLGLYKFNPASNKPERVIIDVLRKHPKEFRLSDLLDYVGSHGGGRLVVFSCSSLAPETIKRHRTKVLEVREYIAAVQDRYIQRNPVVSPRDAEGWSTFLQAFPKVQLPNLTFVNFNTLRTHDHNYAKWILYNLLVMGEFYKDSTWTWRTPQLQKTAAHGRYIQNFGQECEENDKGCCRRKEGCIIQGGTRNRKRKGALADIARIRLCRNSQVWTRRIKRSRNY